MELKLQGTIAEVDNALKKLGFYSPKIAKMITKSLAAKIKSRIKRGVYSYFKKNKGELKDYIKSKNYSSGNSVVYISGTKANALEYGAKILPKNKKYLTFQKDGHWIRKNEINLKGRHYFYPLGDSFINSSEYAETIENILSKEIDKQWSKQ